MFYVGQWVLCVDDVPHHGYIADPSLWEIDGNLDGLAKGTVYTVRDFGPSKADGVLCVWLEEIVRPSSGYYFGEEGYAAARFRPLKDSALDCFTALLEPAPKETEPA